MRICKIWDADYPWDVRVEKVINAMGEAGWHVDLVCRNEKRLPRLERNGHLHIHRLPYLSPALGQFNRLVNFPYFFNPVWICNILSVCSQTRPDVILVRDLPLALTGIFAGRVLGLPIVLDIAENYPAMLRDTWRLGPFRPSRVFVRNPKIAEWVERYALPHADHVIVVVEESAARLLRLGVNPSMVSVVSNTPPRGRIDGLSRLNRPADIPWGDPLLIYLGNLEPGRGVDTLIAALPGVLQMAPRAHLVIIGTGSQSDWLRAQVFRFRVQRSVTFLGWVPHGLAQSYLPFADICVVPHDSTASNNTTISNKLFDYMAAGKVVVVSDSPPTARVVRSVGCGLVFPAGDSCALAEKVGELLSPGNRDEMGQRGRNAIKYEYNWEHDSQVLLEALTAVTCGGCKGL
jgi:glycosyltransferase involved in cell wall biosynthesis